MKILNVAYHNPNFINTAVFREDAIRQLGHDLIVFDDSSFLVPGRLRDICGFLGKWDLDRLNGNLINTARETMPDLCIVVGGYNVLKSTVDNMKNMGIKIVLWTTNVPDNFDNIFESAPAYDRVFCAGTEAVPLLEANGVKEPVWIPYGFSPERHRRVDLSKRDREKYSRDIAFVGSYYPNRANVLEVLADLDIGIWGPYWDKLPRMSPLAGKVTSAKLNYDEWIKIFSASGITAVVHYQDGKTPSKQASPKLFEALACGCFVLVDRQADALSLFDDGKHLVFFKDKEDLRKKTEYYMAHPEERKKVSEAGYEYVIAEHSWRDRIGRIINITFDNR